MARFSWPPWKRVPPEPAEPAPAPAVAPRPDYRKKRKLILVQYLNDVTRDAYAKVRQQDVKNFVFLLSGALQACKLLNIISKDEFKMFRTVYVVRLIEENRKWRRIDRLHWEALTSAGATR